jgi:hypothetical protein
MAEHLIETISRITTPPADGARFDEWLGATEELTSSRKTSRTTNSCSTRLRLHIHSFDSCQDLGTTQCYMHLSPAALDAAIRLLETGSDTSRAIVGEIVEAAGTEGPKAHIH